MGGLSGDEIPSTSNVNIASPMTPNSSPTDLQSVIDRMTAAISSNPNDPDAYADFLKSLQLSPCHPP